MSKSKEDILDTEIDIMVEDSDDDVKSTDDIDIDDTVDVDDDGEEDDEEDDEEDGEDEDEEEDVVVNEIKISKDDEQMKKNIKNAKLKKTTIDVLDVDDTYGVDIDSDDSDDEDEFKKFDQDIKNDFIKEYHSELTQLSFEEIQALSTVIRDDDGNIIDPLHTTVPFITRYERAKVIGVRAKQIHNGSLPFVDVPKNVIDGQIIAEMEYKQKKLPFIIMRPLPDGKREYWKLRDLEIIDM